MTKDNIIKIITRIIILGIVAIICILFIKNCMITKIPDEITRIYEFEPITAYKFYQKNDESYYSIGYEVVPEQPLNIVFKRSMYWPTINDDEILMFGHLYLEDKYETLYVKEISYNYNGKNNILVKDRIINIPMENYDILLDENREPAIIGGKNLYAVTIAHGYFFDWQKGTKFDFTPKRYGQEKEIELIQTYSFDNETWYEEKYKFKVICGGKKFDINRLILNIAGLYL